jgi:hypothetical protein
LRKIIEALIGVFLIIIGVSGFLIPDDFLALTADAYINSGLDAEVEHITSDSDVEVQTGLLMPETDDLVYATIHGNDDAGWIDLQDNPCASTTLVYSDRCINVTARAHLGIAIDTDVEAGYDQIYEVLDYSIYLNKDDLTETIWTDAGEDESLPSKYTVNLLSLEEAYNLTPPYTLNCTGWLHYVFQTNIDQYSNTMNQPIGDYLDFWTITVYENSTLRVTRYTELPLETVQVKNPNVTVLQKAVLPVLIFGVIILVFSRRN